MLRLLLTCLALATALAHAQIDTLYRTEFPDLDSDFGAYWSPQASSFRMLFCQ